MSAKKVPDDVVASVDVAELKINVYSGDVLGVVLTVVGGSIPLKPGERFEVEVAAVERRVVQR